MAKKTKNLVGDNLTVDSLTQDGFNNFYAKLGIQSENLSSKSGYTYGPLISRQHVLLEQIYRSSWIAGQVVDSIAEDMTKEGIEMLSKMSPEHVETLQSKINELNIWTSLGTAIKWSRLYGGAIAVLLTEGADYSTPLDPSKVGKGAFKGLCVLDRWQIEPSFNDLITEIGPMMGMPRYYMVLPSMETMPGLKIHYSRVLRFDGVEMPYYQKKYDNLWGMSVIERMYDRLLAFDSATTGAAQLLYKAYLRVVHIDGLRQALAMGGKTEQAVIKQFQYIRLMQSMEGITLLDAKDQFATHQYTFSGVADILIQFGQQISGATGIPLVRLFGQSPAGLSATGESDLRNYYDHIKKLQERSLRNGVRSLLEVLSMSCFGRPLPDDFGFDFVSLWAMSDTEKAQIASTVTQAVASAFGSSIITKKIAMKELSKQSRISGIFTSITDEDIEEAVEEPPEGQMSGMPGEQPPPVGMPGEQPPPVGMPGEQPPPEGQIPGQPPDQGQTPPEIDFSEADASPMANLSPDQLAEELKKIEITLNKADNDHLNSLGKDLAEVGRKLAQAEQNSMKNLETKLNRIPDQDLAEESIVNLEEELRNIPDRDNGVHVGTPEESVRKLGRLPSQITSDKNSIIDRVYRLIRFGRK